MKRQIITLVSEADRTSFLRFMEQVSLGRPLVITVEEKRKKRSLSANALYFKWMQEAGDHLGYDKDDMHEACKQACDCPVTEIDIDGETVAVRSTAKLNDGDFAAYMDRCYRKLSEMGCYLTLPEEAFA